MKINRKFNNKGFTIVETLIVLAIAAVILIIVLLAVPALQRSSRNATVKNDASTIAGAVSDFESTNGGSVPNGISSAGTTSAGQYSICASTVTTTFTTTCSSGSVFSISQSDHVTLTFGTLATVAYSTTTTSVGTTPSISPLNIIVDFGASCTSTSSNIATTGTTAYGNAVAVVYPVESSSSTGQSWCIQG